MTKQSSNPLAVINLLWLATGSLFIVLAGWMFGIVIGVWLASEGEPIWSQANVPTFAGVLPIGMALCAYSSWQIRRSIVRKLDWVVGSTATVMLLFVTAALFGFNDLLFSQDAYGGTFEKPTIAYVFYASLVICLVSLFKTMRLLFDRPNTI